MIPEHMESTLDIKLIAAMASNRVIGDKGRLPWRIPKDMKRFKDITMGKNVIMGRKTYESIPERYRPLSGRTNIVLSQHYDKEDDIIVLGSLDEVFDYIKDEESYVIGGESVYKQTMPYANTIELTRLEREVEGDSLFPEFSDAEWELIAQSYDEEEIGGSIERFCYETYIRRH